MPTDFTGLKIENVLLMRCSADFIKPAEELHYTFTLSGMERQEEQPSPNRMVFGASFAVVNDKDDPGLKVECTFCVSYLKEANAKFEWKDLGDHLALAHILPFAREFISSVTNRMPVPPLIIPPFNTYALVEEYKRKHAVASAPEKTANC